MVRNTVHHETTGKVRTIGVSLPLVTALRDDPAYGPREDAKPRAPPKPFDARFGAFGSAMRQRRTVR